MIYSDFPYLPRSSCMRFDSSTWKTKRLTAIMLPLHVIVAETSTLSPTSFLRRFQHEAMANQALNKNYADVNEQFYAPRATFIMT